MNMLDCRKAKIDRESAAKQELQLTLENLTALRNTEQATWLAFREAEETMHRCNTAWGKASTLKRQAFDAAMLAHGLSFDALLDKLEEKQP